MADLPATELVVQVMSGPEDGRVVRLRYDDEAGKITSDGAWELTLGRRDDCDIVLPYDTQISRLHARLRYRRDSGWVLEDNGSRNGTFVDQTRLERPLVVTPGMFFRLGRTWLRLEAL
ncbi:MAG: FHA domain-containing protein [Anaerolineae bacterium]|nr:FHA domain-containing protein [Anaerolineae bacterium]